MQNIAYQKWWQTGSQFLLVSLLLISMLVQSSPLFFYMDQYQKNPRPTNKSNIAIENLINKAAAKENAALRTINSNSYENKDGSGFSIISSNSVNYLDNGQLKPIDNTLINISKGAEGLFTNKANVYSTKFKQNSSNYFFSITQDGYTMDIGIENANNVKGQVKDNTITYADILPGTDIVYTTGEDCVKEDIIVKNKPSYLNIAYKFKLSSNLKVEIDSGSNILLKNNSSQNIWILNAPHILGHATGDPVYSKYTLQGKNNEYTASFPVENLLPDSEENYPIIIDPSVVISPTSTDTRATGYLIEYQDFTHIGNIEVQAGMTRNNGETRSLFRYDLANIPARAQIDGAIFGAGAREENGSFTKLNLHRVTGDWAESTIKWSNQPSIDSQILASSANNTAFSWLNFDVTDIVRGWKNGTYPNYGLELKAHDLTVQRKNLYSQYVLNNGSPSLYRPYLIVYYNNAPQAQLLGMKDWWTYSQMPYSEGALAANIANGNLVASFSDFSAQGKGLDLGITHSYNSLGSYSSPYGYNWTISANKRLSFLNGNRQTVIYNDESNTQFSFYDDDNDNSYVDPDDNNLRASSGFYKLQGIRPNGLNMGLKYDTNTQTYTAINNAKLKTIFNSSGQLIREIDRANNSLEYIYSNARLAEIYNSAKPEIKILFSYNPSGYLEYITDPNYNSTQYHTYGQKIGFTYENQDLKTVSRYSDDNLISTTTYNYTDHKLISVKDSRNSTSTVNYSGNRVSELIDAASKKTRIYYDDYNSALSATGHTRVIPPKAYDTTPVEEIKYQTDYYYINNPYFQNGLVKKSIGPKIIDDKGVESRPTTEYVYNDDFKLHSIIKPDGKQDLSIFDDISGLPTFTFNSEKILNTNRYSYGSYENGDWILADSYDGNNTQQIFNYDSNGNLIRKSIFDGDAINYFHNPSLEIANRPTANDYYDVYCNFRDPQARWSTVSNYWCIGGTAPNRTFGLDRSDYQDGLQSQYIQLNNSSSSTLPKSFNVYQPISEMMPLEPNTTYKLNFQYKQTNTSQTDTEIMIQYWKYDNTQIGSDIKYLMPDADNAWKNGDIEFTTPNDSLLYETDIYLRGIVVPNQTNVNGKTWFDAAKLQKKSQTSSYVEKVSRFEYYPNSLVFRETNPEGKQTTFEWDGAGNMLAVTDSTGNRTEYTYDFNGNKISQTEAEGVYTSADPNDFKTTYTYNSRSQTTALTDNKTSTRTTYDYDPNGNLISTVSPLGLKTIMIYDEMNRAKETISPYGYTAKVEYDSHGNPKGITDPNKKSSSINYDSADRTVNETNPNGSTTDYKYDANDNLKTVTLETKTIAYGYDNNGRLTSTTDQNLNGATQAFSYGYDKNSNLISSSTPSGTSTNSYSLTDEITKIVNSGLTTAYHRNKNNQITQIDKSNGDLIKYTYYDNNAVKELTHERNGSNIQYFYFEYDRNGNKTLIRSNANPAKVTVNNKDSRYTYDNFNQLIKTIAPDGKITQNNYDLSGNLREIINPDRTRTVFSYDGNRLIKKVKPDNTIEYYGYDSNGNMTSRNSGEFVSFLANYNGDVKNRRDYLVGAINNDDKKAAVYATGKFGQGLRLDNNSYVSYSSSSNINKSQGTIEFWISPNWSNDTNSKTFIEYYVDSSNYLRIKKNTDNKLQLEYVVNGKDQGTASTNPITWTANNWYHLAASWKASKTSLYIDGQKISENNICSPTAEFCSTYLKPLLKNAQSIVIGASYNSSSPNATNFADITIDDLRITGLPKTDIEISSDKNTISELKLTKTTSYVFDTDDYLVKIVKPDNSTISYQYDSQKRLIKKSATNQSDILYDYEGNLLIAERDSAKNLIAKYVYDNDDALLHIEQGANKYYAIFDGLGSITALRDQSGNTVATYDYDNWGNLIQKTGTTEISLKFASYFWDKDASLYHLGARWYDPSLNRFISVDPHPGDQDDGLSQNEYLYCRNSPINLTDPDGDWIETGLDIASAAYSANEFKKKKSIGNFGWLAFDVVMIIVPIAPGSGVFRAGIKVGKGGKAVSKEAKAIMGITGYTSHGLNQKINRLLPTKSILDAAKNPLKTTTRIDNKGREATKIIGKKATIVKNQAGKIITTYQTKKKVLKKILGR